MLTNYHSADVKAMVAQNVFVLIFKFMLLYCCKNCNFSSVM